MEVIYSLWLRDVRKYLRDKARIFGSLAMPFIFLVLFGSGLSGSLQSMMSMGSNAGGLFSDFSYSEFMFPGIILMTSFMTALFGALSVVEDKEFGYMKEILVAPVSRTAIAIGKILGGSTVAVMQGLIMLVFAPLIGVDLSFLMILQLLGVMIIVAFAISGIGLLLATKMKTTQGFQMIVQMLVMPMIFLSGAMFPINGLPDWMSFVVRINPLTYAVDMFKTIILNKEAMNPMMKQALGLDLEIWGMPVTFTAEILIYLVASLVILFFATQSFKHTEA